MEHYLSIRNANTLFLISSNSDLDNLFHKSDKTEKQTLNNKKTFQQPIRPALILQFDYGCQNHHIFDSFRPNVFISNSPPRTQIINNQVVIPKINSKCYFFTYLLSIKTISTNSDKMFHVKHYLPMQNFPKILLRISSVVTAPIISLSEHSEFLMSTEINSPLKPALTESFAFRR